MKPELLNRRDFVREAAMAGAGMAAVLSGWSAMAAEPAPVAIDTSKILNYNPNMEYRRLGKTGLMVSAVCLGGH